MTLHDCVDRLGKEVAFTGKYICRVVIKSIYVAEDGLVHIKVSQVDKNKNAGFETTAEYLEDV